MSNIIATIHSIKDEAKGPSYSVRRLYEEMYKLDPHLWLLDCDYSQYEIPFSKSFMSKPSPKRLGRSPQMYQWMKEQAKKGQIRLIHNHGLWMMPNVYPGWVARKYNIPLITSPRGTLSNVAMNTGSKVKKVFWPLVQYPAIKDSTCFHATAESEYEDIRRTGFKQPVAIIPNGIDIMNVIPSNVSSPYKTLLFLGRIHPIKGLDLLLKVWHKLQDLFPHWQLKIVGPDNNDYLRVLQNMAQELNLQRIHFLGPLFEDQKWQAYGDADLFVLPSYSENFAMSIAESLAVATPVITTKGTPWKVLEDVNAGLWVDTTYESLEHGLVRLMSLSEINLRQMGQNGKLLMQEQYSWTKIAQMMNELYRWIVNGGECPSFVRLD